MTNCRSVGSRQYSASDGKEKGRVQKQSQERLGMQTQSGGGACYTVHCVSEFIAAVKADIDCPVLPSHLRKICDK